MSSLPTDDESAKDRVFGAARITKIEAVRFSVPLETPARYGKIERTCSASVLVRIKANDGLTGYGEACAVPQLTGESAESVAALVDTYANALVADTEVLDWRRTILDLRRRFPRSFVALAAVETAFLDLAGKALGLPVHHLIGGKFRDRIELCGSVSWNMDPRAMAEEAKVKGREYGALKVYVGPADVASDLRRLEAVRAALDDRTAIMLDVKGLWDTASALKAGSALAGLGVLLVEQPVSPEDHEGAAQVSRCYLERHGLLTTADESAETPEAVARIGAGREFSSLNVGVTRMGGPDAASRCAQVARAVHLPVLVGSFAELGIATAAGIHLAAAIPELVVPAYLGGPARYTKAITSPALLPESGTVAVPDGPGLGVEVDEDMIAELSTR